MIMTSPAVLAVLTAAIIAACYAAIATPQKQQIAMCQLLPRPSEYRYAPLVFVSPGTSHVGEKWTEVQL